ncbi:MAG: D-alanine--D-alanine ligase [Actinomycetota bacterium]|nr:D-alanine--D-alanine ligase [Actinomycetota bacterium]
MSSQSPEATPRKVRVAVVFGGRSTEHAISCVSAGRILQAIDRERYEVVPIGITPEGRWVLAADEPEKLAITGGRLPAVEESGTSLVLAGDPTSRQLVVQESGRVPHALGQVDVVFPVLHGPYGEDGTLQGLLELAGIPYVGSGVFASAAAMDKGHMKALFLAAGLPLGPYELIEPRAWRTDRDGVHARVRDRLHLPVFVKPCRAGSSLGITKVNRWEEFGTAVEEAARHDPRVVVEEGIEGRELECGVLGGRRGGAPEASVLAEIRVRGGHEFYDFEAKYLDDATELDVPADVAPEVSEQAQALACRTFDVLGCEGLARVDFFLRADGTLLVNEVNTMPGFTPVSMFPRMWAASGLDYPALVERLLQLARERPAGLLR